MTKLRLHTDLCPGRYNLGLDHAPSLALSLALRLVSSLSLTCTLWGHLEMFSVSLQGDPSPLPSGPAGLVCMLRSDSGTPSAEELL